MKIPVAGLSLEFTVTLRQGHLSLMHSVENLIYRNDASKVRTAWEIGLEGFTGSIFIFPLYLNGGCFHCFTGFIWIHQGNVNI